MSAWLDGVLKDAQLWSGFWPAILGAISGAFIAYRLGRRRDEADRIRHELGQCNRLVFMLTHLLESLENFDEQLFDAPEKRLGRPALWREIGAYEGLPTGGAGFVIGDYTFLIDGSDRKSAAPQVLSRIFRSTVSYESIIARLGRRNQLWYQYLLYRAAPLGRGEQALPRVTESVVFAKQIEESTQWLQEDIPELIRAIRDLLPQLFAIIGARYPKQRKLIVPQPVEAPLVDADSQQMRARQRR